MIFGASHFVATILCRCSAVTPCHILVSPHASHHQVHTPHTVPQLLHFLLAHICVLVERQPRHPLVVTQERGCTKTYVARVRGIFPDTGTDVSAMANGGQGGEGRGGSAGSPVVVDVPLGWDAKTNHAIPVLPEAAAAVQAGSVSPSPVPGAPPLTLELVTGAKHAETHFRRLSVSPDGLTRCEGNRVCVRN